MKCASILIPARNRADLLPETLAALARQSFPAREFEVVVVDDGSTDATPDVIRARRYPFRLVYVRMVPQPGSCIARVRNHGLYAATGEIAIFLDADVLALPDFVAEHLARHQGARRPQAVIGYTYGYPIRPADRTPDAMQPPPTEQLLEELPRLVERDPAHWRDGREAIYAETRDLAAHPHPWQMFWGHNVSVPLPLALEIGGFDEAFTGWGAEDLEFAYRLWRRGVAFRLARRAGAVHYPHPLPNLEARLAQLQRNRRRLIAKHPSVQLELRLWNTPAYAEAWPPLHALLKRPPHHTPSDPAAVSAFVERLAAEEFRSGPFLLCGELPPGPSARWQPAAWCRPFAAEPGERGSEGEPVSASPCLPLLGVFTPWDDDAFTGAIVGDYWRCLPSAVMAGMVRELLRVAGRVALLAAETTRANGPHLRLRTVDDCAAAVGSLPEGWPWETVRGEGATAFILHTPQRQETPRGDLVGAASR